MCSRIELRGSERGRKFKSSSAWKKGERDDVTLVEHAQARPAPFRTPHLISALRPLHKSMVNAPDAGEPSGQRSAGSVFQCSSMQLVEVPLRVINRPLPSELTEEMVLKFMDDIQVRIFGPRSRLRQLKSRLSQAGDQLTPIEVLRCELPDGRQYYFSFGGCHRRVYKRVE